MSGSQNVPTPAQIRAIKAQIGLTDGIIREIYPTYGDIYGDAGNLGMKQFGRSAAGEKSSLHHVISLLVPWMKKIPSEWNRRSMAQRFDGDLDKTFDTIWSDQMTEEFRNESVDFIRKILGKNYHKDNFHWDGRLLSEVLEYLPSKEKDWQEILLQEELNAASVTNPNGFNDEPGPDYDVKNFDEVTALGHPVMSADKLKAFHKVMLIPEETVTEILTHLSSGRHILLAGPIGTGKSSLARMIGGFWEDPPSFDGNAGYVCSEYSASSDWSTQDVVGGIVPFITPNSDEEKENGVGYKYHEGCFLKTLKKNLSWDGANWIPDQTTEDGRQGTWLLIDEFNRADIDKAFGPLLSALQSGTLSVPDHPDLGHDKIPIPKNFRIIATLNTSDRHHLFKISDALKRRFAYVEIKTPSLQEWKEEINIAYEQAGGDDDGLHSIGTTGILVPKDMEIFARAWQILTTLRTVKGIGTAVLKSIYESMLMGIKEFGMKEDRALDAALTANLIPQMDSISEEALDMMSIMYFSKDPVKELDEIRTDMTKSERYGRAAGIAHIAAMIWNYDVFNTAISSGRHTQRARDFDAWSKDRGGDEKAWNDLKTMMKTVRKEPLDLPEFERALYDLQDQV